MAEKSVIYGDRLFLDGAPLVVAGAELSSRRSGKKSVRLRLKNITNKTIRGATVTVRALDADGNARWGDAVCIFDALGAPRDGEFGQEKSFELPSGEAQSFSVHVGDVIFDGGELWRGDFKQWTPLSPVKTLEESLGDGELATQFKIRYGADCEYMPTQERGLWFCTCGGINSSAETNCHKCRRSFAAQKAVNIGSLKAECAERLRNEQELVQKDDGQTAEKKKKKLRRLIIIGPIALLAALIIAILPGYIAERKAYDAAAALLSAGRYDEAQEAFYGMGSYADSREQAEKNVPYERADYILQCADNGDTPGLTLLGLRRSQFDDEEHMRIALYEGAAETFRELDGYRDSADKLAYAEEAIDALLEKLNSAAYDAAAELLKQGSYLLARDAFAALGDYRDSADMAQECMYIKGAALADFVEKYSVRGVSVSFSYTAGTADKVNFTRDALGRLGEECTAELREICAGDGLELSVDDAVPEALQPMCTGVNSFLLSLGKYKDSEELAERAALAGDFTKPFFDLCLKGDLPSAAAWLNAYDGDFTDRDGWLQRLDTFIPFCRSWELFSGDPTLIPLTVGVEDSCGSFSTGVILDGDSVTLRISFGEEGKYVDLSGEQGSIKFTSITEENAVYFASTNNLGRFTYLKYNAEGKVVSSVEYSPN